MDNESVEVRLIAYHGRQSIKDFYFARVRAHRDADELIPEGRVHDTARVLEGFGAEVEVALPV